MAFRRFRIAMTVRVLLLSATIFIFLYLLISSSMPATSIFFGLAALFQIVSLVRFSEKTNRNLTRFLESIEYSDFSQSFTSGIKGISFDELNEAFTSVVNRFREISLEKEENFRYLQTVVQHVGIGMIAFTADGEVALLNNAVKRLFNIPSLKNISGLGAISPVLLERLRGAVPGQRDLVTVSVNSEMMQLSIYTTELRQRSRVLTLVSIQNISSELNEKEMDAWQNLIRVLTHEIKNSLTPIASLASSVEELLLPGVTAGKTASVDAGDIRSALQTIQKRSHNLLQFVDTYRDLTHIPKPEYSTFPVSELFERIIKLVSAQSQETDISISTSIEPSNLEMTADPRLIEQVLINLVLNSIQALESKPDGSIRIEAAIDERSRLVIRIADNGPGIVEEAAEKVFIPFYSTKKDGSGIGLSLSRQIMRLHRGDLTVRSKPGVETVFTMRF